jgi:hypothetical protein
MEALFVSFSSFEACLGFDFSLGTRDGWRVAKVAGRGHCVQFGNDDVVGKFWVMARASLAVSDGFSCALPCRCGVGAAVECPCGNDDGQPMVFGELGRRKLCIFLLRSSSSKSELSILGM